MRIQLAGGFPENQQKPIFKTETQLFFFFFIYKFQEQYL